MPRNATRPRPTIPVLPVVPVLALLTVLTLATACAEPDGDMALNGQTPEPIDTTTYVPDCDQPLETRDKEAPDQEPAFPEQTRACALESTVAPQVQVIASGLEHPWAVEPLPDGDFLVTEKPGRMRVVTADGQVGEPLTGVPDVSARGQGGLLDVELSPDFASNRTIFWSYAEPRDGGNGTAVARGVLSDDRRSLEQVEVIFRALPTYDGTHHFGSRIAFDDDGNVYITTGERSVAEMREHAQRLDGHMGKVLRVRPDGSAPADNPFMGQEGAQPEIWSRGHRNIQAMAFDPDGRLWTIEHGPRGGDELNLIEPGTNYGWPEQSYGIEYSGDALPGDPHAEGFEQPVYYWDPVIAPSGAVFYTGDLFPEWQGDLFIGALRDQRLVRLRIEDGRVVGEEHLLNDRGQRIRDVEQGNDGALYIVTDEDNGELWRVTPAG